MEDLVDVCSLSRMAEKVLVGLSPFGGGLTTGQLAQRCGVGDLNTLREVCQEMEEKRGMLLSRRGAHGKKTWFMLGKLILRDGWLFWTAQVGENPAPGQVRAGAGGDFAGQGGEKPAPGGMAAAPTDDQCADWAASVSQFWENPPAADRRPEPGRGKTPSQRIESAQVGDNPAPDGSQLKTESLRSEFLKDSLRTGSGGAGRDFANPLEAQNRVFLKNAHLLFGKPVNWHESFAAKPPEFVLGWLAQAWKARQNGKSDRPWGLAYRGLRGQLRQGQPEKQLCANPRQYLPEAYLQACGLGRAGTLKQRETQAKYLPDEPDEAEGACEAEPDEEPAVGPGLDGRISQAWRAVLEQLGSGMTRATYARWVSQTRPAGWDDAAGVLSVAAGSAEAVEWLESRLALSARRMLCGILNREVQVLFVTI